jgi:hypothetical protein
VNGGRECAGAEGALGQLQGMVSEVVSLLNEQAFAQGPACTEQEVCESFSRILLRHWNLCCVKVYLLEEGGGLGLCAAFSHTHVDDAEAARAVGRALAAEVLRTGEEFVVGLSENGDEGGAASDVGALLRRAGLEAGVAVPVSASGALVGVLVAAA